MGPTLTIPGTNIQIPLGPTQPSLSNISNNTTTIGGTQQNQNQNQNQSQNQQGQQSNQQTVNNQNQQQTITIPGTNIQIPTSIGGKKRTNSLFHLW